MVCVALIAEKNGLYSTLLILVYCQRIWSRDKQIGVSEVQHLLDFGTYLQAGGAQNPLRL